MTFEQRMRPSQNITSLEILILQGNLNIAGFNLKSKSSKISALFKSLKEVRRKRKFTFNSKKQTPAGAVFQSVNRLRYSFLRNSENAPFVVADPGSIFLRTASGFLGILVF